MASAKPIVIMGAGPAGLTAAWRLVNAGHNIVVWEADPSYVGGISRTVQAGDYRIDVGGHLFFSNSAEVNEVWRKILVEDFVDCQRVTRLYSDGKFLPYPFDPANAFRSLGIAGTLEFRVSAIKARMNPVKPETTYAQWVVNRFGQRAFDTYFKPYTEKVWGIPCDQISADWAAMPVDGLSLVDAFETRKAVPARQTPQRFHYPRLGPGQMWETAANKILEKGGGIFLDRKVQTIHWDESGVTHVTGTNQMGEFFQQEGYHFLSSIPLQDLMLSLDPPPPKEVVAAARALRHRELITVCLIVNREKVFHDNWIYIHDASVKIARIQNYKNFSAGLVSAPGVTSLGLEYYCFQNDPLWTATDFDLAQLAIRDAVQIGLLRESEIKDAFVVRTPKALPVYDLLYKENLKIIREWVSLFANLQPVGRNGMHHYNNQDHSMMTAMLAVKNVQGGNFDCWRVNSEAGYQEDSKN